MYLSGALHFEKLMLNPVLEVGKIPYAVSKTAGGSCLSVRTGISGTIPQFQFDTIPKNERKTRFKMCTSTKNGMQSSWGIVCRDNFCTLTLSLGFDLTFIF